MPAIVIDPGSYTTKVGVSGNSSPSFILPSNIPGHPSFVRDSVIVDFNHFERYFESIVIDNFKIDPLHWPLVCSVPVGASRRYRESLAEVFFETFASPGVFLEESGVLALHATNSATACVVDLGHSHATLSAVVEGYLVSSEKFPIAGRHVTQFFVDAVARREEIAPGDRKLWKICAKAKEEFGFVAEDVLAVHTEFSRNFQRHQKSLYGLDFGFERFLASEVLFDPKFSKTPNFPGLAAAIENLVTGKNFPLDYRKRVMENLVLSGGCSLLAGLEKRLKKELPKNLKPEFFTWADSGAQGHAVWTGAAKIGADRMISRKMWEEEGSRIFALKYE